jgi:hypothetical protein
LTINGSSPIAVAEARSFPKLWVVNAHAQQTGRERNVGP